MVFIDYDPDLNYDMQAHSTTLNSRLAALRADGNSTGKMFAIAGESDYNRALAALNSAYEGQLTFTPCPNLVLYPFGNKTDTGVSDLARGLCPELS